MSPSAVLLCKSTLTKSPMKKTKAQILEQVAIERGLLPPRPGKGNPRGNPGLVVHQFKKAEAELRTKGFGWKVTKADFNVANRIPDLADRFRAWFKAEINAQLEKEAAEES